MEHCLRKDSTKRPTAADLLGRDLLGSEPFASWVQGGDAPQESTERGTEHGAPCAAVISRQGSGKKSPREECEQPPLASKVPRLETLVVPVPAAPPVPVPAPLVFSSSPALPPALAIQRSLSSDDEDDDAGLSIQVTLKNKVAWRSGAGSTEAWRQKAEGVRPAAGGMLGESRAKKQTAMRLGRHRRTASAPAVTAAALAKAAQTAQAVGQTPTGFSTLTSGTAKDTADPQSGASERHKEKDGADSPFTRFRATPTFTEAGASGGAVGTGM